MSLSILKPSEHPSYLPLPVSFLKASAGIGGFPSPANDYAEEGLDLNEYLINKPAATFFAKASGSSMVNVGIANNDLLVIDRSVTPENGSIVVAHLNGEYVCKILDTKQHRLLSADGKHKPIPITEEMDCLIEGVVTGIIKKPNVRSC